jgi:hypothetical protein
MSSLCWGVDRFTGLFLTGCGGLATVAAGSG